MLYTLPDLFLNFFYLMLYVTNGGSFPKPLSAKDEKLYFERMHAGDKEAKNVLIEKNLRLVAHIIKKYYANFKDQEDLISIGTIGLIKAINTFDSEKGTRLATYASRCIENEILMHFRNLKKLSCEVFITDPIDTDSDGNNLSLIDILHFEDSIEDQVGLKIKIQKLYDLINSVLSEREKNIIALRYGLNGKKELTQRETAKILNISRSYVSRIEKKALLRLAKELTPDEL